METDLKGVLELDGPGSGDRPGHVWPARPRVVSHRVDLDGAAGCIFSGGVIELSQLQSSKWAKERRMQVWLQ